MIRERSLKKTLKETSRPHMRRNPEKIRKGTNLYTFVFFGVVMIVIAILLGQTFSIKRFALSLLGATLLILSSASVPVIAQWIFRRTFRKAEFLVLAGLGGLLFLPVILEGEYLLLGNSPSWLPFLNSTTLVLAAMLLLTFRKTTLSFIRKSDFSVHNHAEFFCFFFLQIVFVLCIVTAYQALPDLDPYKWLYKYSVLFPTSQFDSIERPLFGALTFIGTKLLFTDIFTFYKYIVPFFLILTIFPTWLIASTFQDKKKRIIFLSTLFLSPAILLYGTTPMPQQPVIILSYYFLQLLLYAAISKDRFFFTLAGITAFFGFFIHQAMALFIVAWSFGALLLWYRHILRNKIPAILVFLLLLSNIHIFQPVISFISNWLQIIYTNALANGSFNFLYPAHYTNIDHNSMGWPGTTGVAKFYGFHMGPITGIFLIAFLLFLFQRGFRAFLIHSLRKSPEITTACVSMFLFLAIAEILPRFPNIALLPDRAWIFASIGMIAPAFLILQYMQRITNSHLLIITALSLLSVGGAIYINNLKEHLITPAQWQSAKWITENLPQNRLFLASGYKNLIPIHADSRLFRISPEVYCNSLDTYSETIQYLRSNHEQDILPSLKTATNEILNSFEIQYNQAKTSSKKREILEILESNVDDSIRSAEEKLRTTNKQLILFPPELFPYDSSKPFPVEDVFRSTESTYSIQRNDQLYIYYARSDPKNPYNQRSYTLSSWGFDGCPKGTPFVFDQHPEKFTRVYDDHKEVIIWKVL